MPKPLMDAIFYAALISPAAVVGFGCLAIHLLSQSRSARLRRRIEEME